jgi:hypothetical protein
MDELERLADQLRRALEGEAWHGPAVLDVLAGVSPDQARARPIPGAHTIWELVLHLGGAYRLVLRRLLGRELARGGRGAAGPQRAGPAGGGRVRPRPARPAAGGRLAV